MQPAQGAWGQLRRHTRVEAALDRKPRSELDQPAGWVVWPGPERGYIALDGDLPQIVTALEALWFLRTWGHDTHAFLAARGGVSGRR